MQSYILNHSIGMRENFDNYRFLSRGTSISASVVPCCGRPAHILLIETLTQSYKHQQRNERVYGTVAVTKV